MAVHGTERQEQRDRDYVREELARLTARCAELEQAQQETERRLRALENFMTRMLSAR